MDGEAGTDLSGAAVAMSHDGTVVAIGAHGNDAAGSNAGHVRVFALDGNNWVQRGSDIDGQSGDFLGRAVALNADGTNLVVGIPNGDSPSGSDSGAVRVFTWNGASWSQRGTEIVGVAVQDSFGWSVDVSDDGTVVAIGAHYNDQSGLNAGHVRVYAWFGGNWVQRGGDINGEYTNDYSGYDVSCNAACSVVAVGAYGNDDGGSMAGHTRVYSYSTVLSSWVQRGADIDGSAVYGASGKAIALNSDGNTLIIGAHASSSGTFSQNGMVSVYIWNSGSSAWTQRGADMFGESATAWFGSSVAVNSDGNSIVVGASLGKNENGVRTGQVKVYKWDVSSSAWVVNAQALYGDAGNDYFGGAVALSSDGKTICVGAFGNDNTDTASGSVKVFKLP